jgi:hypothetical protein
MAKDKPSFWIDQESAEGMNDKLASVYDKYKATKLKISAKKSSHAGDNRQLLQVSHLSLGYNNMPLLY